MQPFKPRQCTEREPGGNEDCTWCAGVMLANAGFGANIAPSTRVEYESLRVAGGDGPAEKSKDGSNLSQLLVGMRRQYSWAPAGSSSHADWTDVRHRLEDVGDCAVLQGSMGVFAKDSNWRRWDVPFDGAHAVFVERLDGEDRLWWMNPQAPNSYAGEFISLADARRYYEGLGGGALYTRVGKVKTSKVRTNKLARLFVLKAGVVRPIESSSGSFTFNARVGDNVTLTWAPGPHAAPVGQTVFRRILGPVHAGMYIRVSDQGSTWIHPG
jgi:hypothetical protein